MKDFFKNLPDESTPFEADRFNELLNGEEAMESIAVDDITSKNVFNKDAATKGYRISKDDGTLVANEAVGVSGSIDVTGKTKLIVSGTTISYTNGGAFFDSFKNYISGFTSAEMLAGVNIPSTAKYVRINTLLTELDTTQVEFNSKKTDFTPYKKFGYNSDESMGKIIVDDISSNNKLDINSLVKGHIISSTGEIATTETSQISSLIVSDNSVTFTTTDVWKGISSGFMEVKPLTPYYFLYETTSTAEIYFYVSCYDKNKNHLGRATKNDNEFITLENTKYVRWCTQLVAVGTITLTNLQFKDENLSNYIPHVDFKNEIQYLTNFITAKSGYTIKSQNIFRQNNHYWGNVVIQKDSGTFGSTQEDVATLGASIKGNVNSGCFMSAGQWSAKNVGYLYMGDNYIKIADPNATTNNIVKIDINVVV